MSFPSSPVDGQVFTTTVGSHYRFVSADNKWVKYGIPPIATGIQGLTGLSIPGYTGFRGVTGAVGPATYQFYASTFDNPVGLGWAVTGLAPADPYYHSYSMIIRLFDDTNEESVGFMIEPPLGSTNMKLDFRSATAINCITPSQVILKLYKRDVGDNVSLGSWSAGTTLTAIDIPVGMDVMQYDTQTIALSTLGVTAGRTTQFQLSRVGSDGNDTLSGDWALLSLIVSFS